MLYAFIILVLLALIVDAAQTLDIKNHPDVFETNIILGPHPSDRRILAYFPVCAIVFVAICLGFQHFDAPLLSWLWTAGWLVVEVSCIHHNYRLGLTATGME